MKNKYYPLRSSMDELSTKNDNEIDLEKGPLPEYNSEDGSTLPPYSENLNLKDPKQMGANNPNLFNTDESTTPPDYGEDSLSTTHRENHSSGTADNSCASTLKKAILSFIPIFVLNVSAVCYLTYKDALFKDYGKDEWVYFGMWCASCLMILISLWCFYETWIKAVKVTAVFLAQCIKVTAVFLPQCIKVTAVFLAKCVKVTAVFLAKCIKVTAVFLAQCVKVTAISLAKCVKVISIGLFNIRREMMIIIWILWLIICCILFGCVKDGRLNFNKALICSTCTISAVLFLIVSSVCIPIWTLWRALSGMLQVLGIHGIIAVLVNGSMSLFGKHFGWRGYEIEGFVLFFTSSALFLYEMERPGVLKRMRNTTGNVIGYICGVIGDAFRRIENAFRGANDNNNIPLGEMDVEGEV
uniref:Meiotic driver wtf33 n=2 Tax=Schizosaccharomyces kambucha TaxID=204045 RepID=WTF33_SCHKA|nr:RecName: Full=Meiotic driver wtf33 [Schizosaccharomyces kambucha]QBL54519.1 Wtf33 [Schizosaccharomyces kambucha]